MYVSKWLQRLQLSYPTLPEIDLYYNANLLAITDNFFRELYKNVNINFSVLHPNIGKFTFDNASSIIQFYLQTIDSFFQRYDLDSVNGRYTFVLSKTIEYALKVYYKYLEYPIFRSDSISKLVANIQAANEVSHVLPYVQKILNIYEAKINSLLQLVDGYQFCLNTNRQPNCFRFHLIFAYDSYMLPSFYTLVIPYIGDSLNTLWRAYVSNVATDFNFIHIEEVLQAIGSSIHIYPTLTSYLSYSN